MKLTDARMVLDNGNEAVFVDVESDLPQLPDGPMLAIHVADFEEAQEIIATLDRSNARKPRTTVKPPAHGCPPPVKCIVPDCTFDADTFEATDNDLCRNHHDATQEMKAAWRAGAKKPTPAPIARKRAKEIGEQLAGGDSAKASA